MLTILILYVLAKYTGLAKNEKLQGALRGRLQKLQHALSKRAVKTKLVIAYCLTLIEDMACVI